MAYGGLNKETNAAAEIGRYPTSKHQIQPEYEDEHAEAGRDCRTGLAKPNSQAPTDRELIIFHVQLTMSRIGVQPYMVDNYYCNL